MTPRFLDPLEVVQIGEGRWRLLREFRFDSAVLGGRLVIDAGFETDFASVPRWTWGGYALVANTAQAAAVLHDWAYRLKRWPRREADALFLEAMSTDGSAVGIPCTATWRRWLIYAGVRVGGWAAWG